MKQSKNPYPYQTEDEWQEAIHRAERAGNYDEAERINAQFEAFLGFGPAGSPKYWQYTLPGGENYRELLLTLPSKNVPKGISKPEWLINTGRAENMPDAVRLSDSGAYDAEWLQAQNTDFTAGHYDEPNIVAHIRFNERVNADGEKVLFIEEIQSDWAQKGRKEGFGRKLQARTPRPCR